MSIDRPKLTQTLEVPKGALCAVHLEVGSEVLATGAFVTYRAGMPTSPTGRLALKDAEYLWVCASCGQELERREAERLEQGRRQLQERSRRRSSEYRQKQQKLSQVFRDIACIDAVLKETG